jgi:hypothetical protein
MAIDVVNGWYIYAHRNTDQGANAMSYDRRAIMTAAWARYRAAYRNYRLQPTAFREALRIEWSAAKHKAETVKREAARRALAVQTFNASPVAAPVLSPMEARIDALKYLPFRYDLAAAERAIRAEYAV